MEQKFRIGERVETVETESKEVGTIWIVDKVELRVRLGCEPHLVYGIRKLNSYDNDPNGVCCFYFREDELISLEKR